MTTRNKVTVFIVTLSMFSFFESRVFASNSGLSYLLPFSPFNTNDTGQRQLIKLYPRKQLLVGFPQESFIKMVTLSATSLSQEYILLRELENSDGTLSVLFSSSFHTQIDRMTVFIKKTDQKYKLLKYVNGDKKYYYPTSISVSELTQEKEHQTLDAFVTEGLGLYWLLNNEEKEVEIEPPKHLQSLTAPLGGRYHRALFVIFTGPSLLFIGWIISLGAYKKEVK